LSRKLLLFCLSTLLLNLAIHAQNPVASFTPSITSGCSPLVVNFTNNSTGVGPFTYSWYFGPTVSPPLSVTANPTAIFTVSGNYSVTLTVTDANGNSNTSMATIIKVLPTPIADFDATIVSGCFPLLDQFQDKSTPGGSGASLTSWNWSFGDGSTLSGSNPALDQNPSHTYTAAGLAPAFGFPVTLQVYNSFGCSGSTGFKTNSGYITIANGVSPNFSDSLSSTCHPKAFFTNGTSGGAPGITYLWEFGDGNSSTSNSPSYSYSTPKTYTVTLVASSTAGCVDSVKKPISIPSGGVQSIINGPPGNSVCVGVPVSFSNGSIPGPLSDAWNFGNGSTSNNLVPPPVTYTAVGQYTVTLANHFTVCDDTTTQIINVVSAINPTFTYIGDSVACKPPLTISFSGLSTGNVLTWNWNFGDGTISNQQNVTHTFTSYGSFPVSLTVTYGAGCSGVSRTMLVQVAKPVVHLTNLPAYGCGSLTMTPTSADTAVDGITSYNWNFDNGKTSGSANPGPVTFLPGAYNVSLTILTADGCSTTASDSVKIGTIKPKAGFTESATTACTGAGVQFMDTSLGNPNQWSWDFGDGTQGSTIENPSHGFSTPGKYTVQLIAYNHGCSDTIAWPNLITVIGPVSLFSYTVNCSNQNQVQFHDNSIGPISSWTWIFGDGDTLTGSNPAIDQNPSHLYTAAGNYVVVLTVIGTGNCPSTSRDSIVGNQKFSFIANNNPICKNSFEQFSTLNYTGDSLWYFDFGDGSNSGWLDYASPSHQYTQPGNYNVKEKVIYENGCMDSVIQNSLVKVYGPTAGFSATNLVGCDSVNAHFLDSSKSDGTHPIINWNWNFGQGSINSGTQTSPSFLYKTQGIYSVQLVVTDSYGCTDTALQNSLVTVSVPQAIISGPDSTCPGSSNQFNNASQGGFNPSFTWSFDDGTPNYNGFAPNPQHQYTTVGSYNLTLSMTDMYGCVSTTGETIVVDTPHAFFNIDTNFSSCPPLIVHFTYSGNSYYGGFQWQFGDGGVNNDSLLVSNYYTKPGFDTARLIVTSPGGCVSSFSRLITIFGPTGDLSYTPLTGCDSLLVTLNVVSSAVVQYIWIFGDTAAAQTTSTPSVMHWYYPPQTIPPPAYTPGVILSDPNGCSVTQFGDSLNDMILAIGVKPNFGTNQQLFCDSGTVQFTDSTVTNDTIVNYIWDFGDGTTPLNGMHSNPSHFYAAPGLYNVNQTVFTKFGCSGAKTLPGIIKVVASPVVGIDGANSQCVPGSLTFIGVVLVADTSSIPSWRWNLYNGQTLSGQSLPAQLYTQPGLDSVQLIATNSSGCNDTTVTNFTLFPLPTVSVTADTTICLGQNLPLQASGAATYNWSLPSSSSLSCSNCPDPLASPTITTSYIVTGTSAQGCQASDTMHVTVNQPVTVQVLPPTDSVCVGQSVQLTASGAALYSWSPAEGLNNSNIANPLASPAATTLYQVTGSDNKNCFHDTETVTVTVFNYPTLNLGPAVTIPSGSSYQINANGSSDIISENWSPSAGLSCTNCLSPLATPQNTTLYTISAVNGGGCSISDSIKITVVCTDNNFFVPNTFSPNGDGVNDVFYVRGKGLNILPSIMIFNRWGQIVFEKKDFAPNDPSAGWDGTFNGQKAPVDVYIYTLQVICENSTIITYSGNVALIR